MPECFLSVCIRAIRGYFSGQSFGRRHWAWVVAGMKRILCITTLFAWLATGCRTATYSNLAGTLPLLDGTQDGTCLFYGRDGRLLAKSNWRRGKLVSAWEYEQRDELPLEIIEAVRNGEQIWPPPRWVQKVKRGNGRINKIDDEGQAYGWEEYHDGEFVRGAH